MWNFLRGLLFFVLFARKYFLLLLMQMEYRFIFGSFKFSFKNILCQNQFFHFFYLFNYFFFGRCKNKLWIEQYKSKLLIENSRAPQRIYFINLRYIRVSFTNSVFFPLQLDIQICAVFESRLQLIKHVEIIYIEPIYSSVGVIKSRSSRLFQTVFGWCYFFFSESVCFCWNLWLQIGSVGSVDVFFMCRKNDLRHIRIKIFNYVVHWQTIESCDIACSIMHRTSFSLSRFFLYSPTMPDVKCGICLAQCNQYWGRCHSFQISTFIGYEAEARNALTVITNKMLWQSLLRHTLHLGAYRSGTIIHVSKQASEQTNGHKRDITQKHSTHIENVVVLPVGYTSHNSSSVDSLQRYFFPPSFCVFVSSQLFHHFISVCVCVCLFAFPVCRHKQYCV